MKTYIYKLLDPRDQSIKYIGKTNHIRTRLRKHLTQTGSTRKHKWIKCLKKERLIPIIVVIEICNGNNVDEREKYWIRFYKQKSLTTLCNHTEGGEGGNTFGGRKHQESSKRKIGEANKNNRRPDLARMNREILSKIVYQINPLNKKIINQFSSVRVASQTTGASKTNISKMANGTLKRTCKLVGGYLWKYAI